ncbi:SUN-domain-containing protein [Massarina eburnea CBS 473.64]|uniref:SUN-domain-containing protein n=1 Tax=Massarina eburnea CBS 473.64 TaxID=1395130 RepID=A0A6A6S8P7_9PLEO|nr:SUN-domain-containing protein [Massarina eburnea CBS 473.64]
MRLHVVVLAAAVANALAQPHRHGHRHVAKRNPADAAAYVPAPVATVVVYMLNGHTISEEDVRQGIANGTLAWGDDGVLSSSVAVSVAQPTSPPKQAANPEPKAAEAKEPVESSPPAQASEAKAAEAAVPSQSSKPSSSKGSSPVDKDGNCADCSKEFINNYHPCSQFPTGYGAIHLGNEGLGGWSGIQDPKERGAAGYDNIYTVSKGSCSDGACCTPGSFCSYACPNPYLKMSFPKKQGKTGQSVGGLYCNKDGKLEMADGALGKTLCGKGSSHFKVKVENKLTKPVSICRTDYPGTESETVPLTIKPGQTGELANPDQSAYYFWGEKATSAQYYINKQGVSESEACTWGNGADAVGNWAPANFGTSWDDLNMNIGFSGLSQNKPTNPNDRLDFDVTFTGDGVSNPCKFKKSTGEYCSGDNCGRDVGCTASVSEGSTLTLVFTD